MDLLRMKKLCKYVAALGIMCMISTPVYAVLVGEEDGTPSYTANSCWALKVANGNLTPNSDGTCSLADQTGGEAGNHALDSSTHTNVNNISEAKGQLLVQGGVNWDALPLGTEGYVLRVVNANTLGVNWEDLSAIETDPTVDTSAEIQAIIGAGVYEPSGVAVADITDATADGRSLISSTNYASMRGLLDLEAGTDFLAYSAFSANGISLVGAANYAAMRTLLDLEAGTDFYSISAADTLLAAKLALAGGTLTGELVADETGIEGQPTDALTDCSTFSATGGGIFYDDSEGQWKKCEDNVLSDLDTGSSITATDTHVLFSDGANNPAGDAGFTYNKTTDTVTVLGPIVVGGTGQSTITEGLIVNSGKGADADDDFIVHGDTVDNILNCDSSANACSVPTEAYDATGWNGDLSIPTKDAVRDKIETISASGGADIGVRVSHDANQSISNASLTVLAFNSESYDTDTMHDNTTNNSRITFTTAGKYIVTATITFEPNSTGDRLVEFYLNGTTGIARTFQRAITSKCSVSLTTEYNFSASDYLQVRVYQDSTASINVETQTYSPVFTARKVDAGG